MQYGVIGWTKPIASVKTINEASENNIKIFCFLKFMDLQLSTRELILETPSERRPEGS